MPDVLDGGHIGSHLEDREVWKYPEWKPFAAWFEYYHGEPPRHTPEHVKWFECFYAGQIYQHETATGKRERVAAMWEQFRESQREQIANGRTKTS